MKQSKTFHTDAVLCQTSQPALCANSPDDAATATIQILKQKMNNQSAVYALTL